MELEEIAPPPVERGFVIDTNVVISAALFVGSTPSLALRRARQLGRILASDGTLAELGEVLRRPRFRRFVSIEATNLLITEFIAQSRRIADPARIAACRDPKDDKFLELAVAGQAVTIITGDADLLSLDPFRGIPILTPAAFLQLHPPS